MRWRPARRGGSLTSQHSSGHAAAWAARLSAIGAELDALDAPVSGLALSLTGDEARVSALGWHTSRYHTGWHVVAFPVGTASPDGPARGGPWETRLRGIGRLLDGDGRPVRDPCIVELGDAVLVTALVPAAEGWALANWAPATGGSGHEALRRALADRLPRPLPRDRRGARRARPARCAGLGALGWDHGAGQRRR